ncbi:hypothetical protein ACFL3G_07370 [Planctomycetota bacterium]
MKKNKSYLALTSGLITLIIVVWLSTTNCGGDTFEIRPEISVPEQRTDAARAIDAYERMIDRYMSITERNFKGIGADIKDVLIKLDSIDTKLIVLSQRIAKIERVMGIKSPKKAVKKKIENKKCNLISEPNSRCTK